MCGVVHAFLQGTVQMREGFCTASEAHVFAEVIPSLGAVGAIVAHDASLYRDTLSDDEVLDTWTHSGNYSSRLVTEYEWCLELEITVAPMDVIVHCWVETWLRGVWRRSRNNIQSLPQSPVLATATWTCPCCGGQRVRSSTRRSLGPWRTTACCERRATGDIWRDISGDLEGVGDEYDELGRVRAMCSFLSRAGDFIGFAPGGSLVSEPLERKRNSRRSMQDFEQETENASGPNCRSEIYRNYVIYFPWRSFYVPPAKGNWITCPPGRAGPSLLEVGGYAACA